MGVKHFSHLKWKNRLRIEQMLKEGCDVQTIADALRVHNSTIYREIRRGKTTQLTTGYEFVEVYCADTAQRKYEENMEVKGPGLKIGRDRELAEYLEDKMLNEKYSPAAALASIEESGKKFSVKISRWTLYSYISKGVFASLTNEHLPQKSRRKRGYRKVREARLPRGASIEERPEEVLERAEPGDWEMDSVVSANGSKKRLVALTERVTRKELVFLTPDGTAESVVKVLDGLERKLGTETFRRVFRSITVDNGSEFTACAEMQRSCLRRGERTKIYYCHPYSSFERGSNENANRLIRRWLPKGTSFKKLTHRAVMDIQRWINAYPRAILGYRCADKAFAECMHKAGLSRALAVL